MNDIKPILKQLTRNLPERLDALGRTCGLSRQALMSVIKSGLSQLANVYSDTPSPYPNPDALSGHMIRLIFRQSGLVGFKNRTGVLHLKPPDTPKKPNIVVQIHPPQTEGPADLATPVVHIFVGLHTGPDFREPIIPILRELANYLTVTMEADEPSIQPIRSVMDPVPMPRRAATQAGITARTSAIEGLGRLFTGYRSVPDLDILGGIATKEAEALFWEYLEKHLDEALPKRWNKEPANAGQTKLVFMGVQVDEAKRIWRSVTETMNATRGGPGLQVADPFFQKNNRLEDGEVVIETTLLLWPEEHLKPRWGQAAPAVTFRREASPGYSDLLRRQGPRDFFADGWLWKWYGNEREGFRIGGLDRLLYPEGREALERIRWQGIKDIDAELNKIFQNPSLFKDEDQEVVAGLQRAKAQATRAIERLSVYGWQETATCILEAFYRQRDAWANHKIKLPSGKEISTEPDRLVVLDPHDLRARLDPGQRWGQNWRTQMFNRLEALTTFQRQTRTNKGRKVDVGDTFLRRVIDGRRTEVDESEPGLIPMLQHGGAIPSGFFFVEISFDFINRLFTWESDSKGLFSWGLIAGEAAEDRAISSGMKKTAAKEKRREVERKARAQPTYDHSPRLMSVANLGGWPIRKKHLVYAIHQEKTPNYEPHKDKGGRIRRRKTTNRLGGKDKLENIDGQDFIAFNGNRDNGYRLRTWAEKVPMPAGARGYRDLIRYLGELNEGLGLQVRVKDESWTTREALKRLGAGVNSPSIVGTILKLYLPVDMEHQLSERLLRAGIDSTGGQGTTPPALKPMWPGGPTPGELKAARNRAGLKQGDLAQKIGVAQGTISYWERGEVRPPEDKRAVLAKLLGFPYQS